MILVIFGTRPEAIKLAPVVVALRARGLPVRVHCTNQSKDLLDPSLLPWQDAGPTPWVAGAKLVVVQGDTRTAFEGAVAAYEAGVPIFHVEAGVRTYDTSSPWPEEGYRQMISRIADYHACTTLNCRESLLDDGIGGEYSLTGSPLVESVRDYHFTGPIQRTILLTLHRRENQPYFADILRGVEDASTDYHVLWPSHPNGYAVKANPTALSPKPPMDRGSFLVALATATCVVTDSGGVQEEANILGVPCVVARGVTDRPESLGAGGAILGGVTRESVAAGLTEALAIDRTTINRTIFGDGTASDQIADWIQEIVE